MCKSIEGRRGVPRRRWPLPVHQGFRKRPTVVNNVETYACVAAIGQHGGRWFARHGTTQSTGTKWFCVSGDVDRPGAYEYPHGVSLREVLRDAGGRDPKACQVSGASGTMISEKEFDRALAFEDLPSVGTIMVIGRDRDIFDAVWNFAHFFQHESCGLCTPCRVGTTLLVRILEKFQKGWGSRMDLVEVKRIANTMRMGAHCGLGQSAWCHVVDSISKFPQIYDSRMQSNEYTPAFDLDGALEEARQLAKRNDALAHVH
jgi:[NiFe] hydrogenase diaphorase moiety large subunit